MERILTDSEKIRRAEEIYARRRGIEIEENEEKNKNFIIYKIFFRTLLLFNIIVVVLCIQNKELIFKEEFLNKFSIYSQIIDEKINLFINELKDEKTITENQVVEDTSEAIIIETQSVAQLANSEQNVEKVEEIAQEPTIIDKIKNGYSFIKPVEGTVTSFFGDRQSTYQNVTGNHKGIDIGATTGTKIISSIEGIVTQVSSEGDYRKTLKNRKR